MCTQITACDVCLNVCKMISIAPCTAKAILVMFTSSCCWVLPQAWRERREVSLEDFKKEIFPELRLTEYREEFSRKLSMQGKWHVQRADRRKRELGVFRELNSLSLWMVCEPWEPRGNQLRWGQEVGQSQLVNGSV